MSVLASQISKSGAKGKELDTTIREQLQIIDDKLLKAERTWGRNSVTHELPVSISIPGLAKKDAQRILYSAILRSLERRGFEVRILLDDDHTILYIVWTTDLDSKEVDAMNFIIRSKRISADAVEDFIQVGNGSREHPRQREPAASEAANAEKILLGLP